jgi:hypothetical protein
VIYKKTDKEEIILGLTHWKYKINRSKLTTLQSSNAPVVAGAIVGYLVGEAVGGVAGGLLGLFLTGKSSQALLDEQDSIWYWDSYSWAPVYIGGMWRTVPLYYRISAYTLWNVLGISDP